MVIALQVLRDMGSGENGGREIKARCARPERQGPQHSIKQPEAQIGIDDADLVRLRDMMILRHSRVAMMISNILAHAFGSGDRIVLRAP
jgi:hypothetical protein